VSKKVMNVAASIARSGSRVSARQSVAESHGYHKATVESEHGSQQSRLRWDEQKAANRHSSQRTARWSVVEGATPQAYGWGASPQSVRPDSKQGSKQSAQRSVAHSVIPQDAGWDALPQLDGAAEDDVAPSAHSAAAYEKQLQDIIAHYSSPPTAADQQPASSRYAQPQDVQLQMPWDITSSSTVRSARTSRAESPATITPASAAYSAAASNISGTYPRVYTRGLRTPSVAASVPVQLHNMRTVEQAASEYQAPAWPSRNALVSSGGLDEIERAERGYGGHW